ncbi:hypothetical protein C8R43DRAFT_494922 [Mycena crocata]|nr:hypothetical protein C8R43DRAFT_494922 [Mycena crocata]
MPQMTGVYRVLPENAHIPTTNGSASGTMTIWGSQDAITDITSAADWEILGCDPNALSQDIRLVCKSDAPDTKCSHLYQNIGAEGKIVRLPENCGSNAFARIAKAWVPEDQSIPSTVAARLVRRDGTQPEVKALSLDTNFDAVDSSKIGVVNIAIQGANVPGASGTIQIPPSRRSTRLSQRGFFDFVKNAIKSIATNSINVDKTVDLKPFVFDKKINLLDESIDCGSIKAKVRADLTGHADVLASVGVAATGTLIPPKITDFGVIAGLNGKATATLDLKADVAGKVDSGKINLVKIGIPGLDFPGILTIGPTFQVDVQATASLDVNLDMTVGINLDLKNAQLRFPPGDKDDDKAFSIGDTPLTLSASPDVTATGTVAAHLIPSLNLGVSALGNIVKAQIFLNLDTSASLKLSLDGSGSVQTVIDNSANTSTKSIDSATAKEIVTSSTKADDASSTKSTSSSGKVDSTTAKEIVTSTTKADDASSTQSTSSSDSVKSETSTTASTRAMSHTTTSKKAMSTSTKSSHHKTKSSHHKSKNQHHDGKKTTTHHTSPSKSTSTQRAMHTTIATTKSSSVTNAMHTTAATTKTSATVNMHTTATTKTSSTTAMHTTAAAAKGEQMWKRQVELGGCVELDAGIAVNVGADGSFFGLFDKAAKKTLFSKNFVILKKCFGSAAPKRSLFLLSRLDRASSLGKRALACPAAGLKAPVPALEDTVIKAADIKAV